MSSLNISNFIWNIADDVLRDISVWGKPKWRTLCGVKAMSTFYSAAGPTRALEVGFDTINSWMNGKLGTSGIIQ